MAWREATMWEACEFMQGRTMLREIVDEWGHGSRDPASGIEFEDHSKVVCQSSWTGPYSRETPDIDAEPPKFYIFEPENT